MSLLPALRDFFNFPEFSPTNWRDFDTRPVVNIKDLSAGFSPNVDVKETAEHIIIHADLAGIPKDDIHIDFENGYLKLSGKREEQKDDKDSKWYRMERRTGSFTRAIVLPKGVEPKDITATHKDGVLEITVKKPKGSTSSPSTRVQILDSKL